MTLKSVRSRASVASFVVAVALVGTSQVPATAVVSADPGNGAPQFNGSVYAIKRTPSTVYVGGRFTRVTDARGHSFHRDGAAAYDARTGHVLPWNPDVSGEVREIAVSHATAYLGGAFTAVAGVARRNLASVRASGSGTLRKFRTPVNGAVYALAVTKNRLYVGGSFTRVAGVPRAHLASIGRRAPNHVTRWRPRAEYGAVESLASTRSGILVGGYFSRLNGRSQYARLAKVNRRSGALVTEFDPPIGRPVLDLTNRGHSVFVAAGGPGGGTAAGFALGDGHRRWLRTLDGDVAAIGWSKKTLYVGGHFNTVCSTNHATDGTGDCLDGGDGRQHLAALGLDGSLLPWNPGANSNQGVWEITTRKHREWVAVGGDFTQVGGETHRGLAVLH